MVINRVEEEKILSINNMLQCVKLIGNGWAFKRVMMGPNNRVYIEECKSQKPQNAGDFVCQIKEIVDTIIDQAAMLGLRTSPFINKYAPNPNRWQLLDINIDNSKTQYELWRTKEPINK